MALLRRHGRKTVLLGTALLVMGCTVGPDYERPQMPATDSYAVKPVTGTESSDTFAGQAQNFDSQRDIEADWWTVFHSPEINTLVAKCLQNNPDLKAGQATLLAARENVLAQRGLYYPSISASASATRQKTAAELSSTPNSGALTFDLFVPQLNVSYAPDVFGLNKRTVESLSAQAEQARYALLATRITLTANLIAAVIQEASLKSQIAAAESLIASDRSALQILQDQAARGYANRLDVATQENLLAQAQATLPPLRKQLATQHDLVAVLVGVTPNIVLPEPDSLAKLDLPADLPLSVSSKLLEQRPDIRQAEENLHSASAQIGIAVANRLPNITLSGDVGSMALTIGQMFASGSNVWAIGAGVTQPIFDGGQLLHKERAARATFEAAVNQYRSTALSAFQNVADTLNALQQDADELSRAAAVARSSEVTLRLTRQQLATGYVNALALLNAEQSYQQAQIALIEAQAARYADTTAFFQALGGGWWNDKDASGPSPKA
jgi:NodT family efflux transporter outer membrane factor (OMF) lipoprotein